MNLASAGLSAPWKCTPSTCQDCIGISARIRVAYLSPSAANRWFAEGEGEDCILYKCHVSFDWGFQNPFIMVILRINDDHGGGDDDDGVDGDDDDVDDDGNAFNLLAVSEMAAVGANRASQT